jgi:hypothetical protein
MEWVYKLHENVNRDLNKDKFSYNKVEKIYNEVDHDQIFKFIEISIYELSNNLSLSEIQNVQLFIRSMENIFPCEGCRVRLKRLIKENPLHFHTKEDIVEWYKKIKDKWEENHGSPRNLLLVEFANRREQYIQPISLRGIKKVGNYYYNPRGELYVELEGKNGKKREVQLMSGVEFQKRYEIRNISLKRKIDMEFLIGYQNIARKYNNELEISKHHKIENDIKYYVV